MLLRKIPLNDGYEIHVEYENGLYRAQGFLNGKPVTEVITKNFLQASADSLNKTAKNYYLSTAKAIDECGIDECGIDECLTLNEVLKAISSKLPDELAYQDIVSVVGSLLKGKPNFFSGTTPLQCTEDFGSGGSAQ